MKLKKMITLGLAMGLLLSMISCSSNNGSTPQGEGSGENDAGASVYYLSFKPELAQVWEEIGKIYTEETGVPVKIMTGGSNYATVLKAEMSKNEAPTLFQITGPVGYQEWKDYTMDLKDSSLYSLLTDPSLAITDGDGVFGIPYVVEGYGILYNDGIMQEYFALNDTKVKSMAEVNNFDTLKVLVEDMQARKEELSIEGVFSSTSFTPAEDWRWNSHLMNVPVYYEYKDDGVDDKSSLDFRYHENFKNVFDLYINHSITPPTMLGSKSVADSMAEFALGKTAMIQNGSWAWGQIAGLDGNVVLEENIKYLPIYTGVPGEEKQGLCIGTENYFAVNSQVSPEKQQASLDFVEWVFTSEKGKELVKDKLGFITPFSSFSAQDNPSDPLAQEVVKYMNDEELYSVSWNFTTFPSQTFKDGFGANLLQYASGSRDWPEVVDGVVTEWELEKEYMS